MEIIHITTIIRDLADVDIPNSKIEGILNHKSQLRSHKP